MADTALSAVWCPQLRHTLLAIEQLNETNFDNASKVVLDPAMLLFVLLSNVIDVHLVKYDITFH